MQGWRGKLKRKHANEHQKVQNRAGYMKLIYILIIVQLHPLVAFSNGIKNEVVPLADEKKNLLWQRAAAFSYLM